MEVPELIYCAGGNKRFAEIAIDNGFIYGAQLPSTVYFPIEFADQNWKKPDKEKYIKLISEHRPKIATVLDWEYQDEFYKTLEWAEEIACYVDVIVIIPKVNELWMIPSHIGGKKIRLGYSVPTKYGGTNVPVKSFGKRETHLLGGNPLVQYKLARKMNVKSIDCNYQLKMATRYNQFFVQDGSAKYAVNKYWPTLKESANGKKWGDGTSEADAPYEAFMRSCIAIVDMWHGKMRPRQFDDNVFIQGRLNA